MRSRVAALIVSLSLGSADFAGAEPGPITQSFGGDAGLALSSVRDDLLTPLAFSGGRVDLGLRYSAALGPGTLLVGARAGLSILAERHLNPALVIDHNVAVRFVLPFAADVWSLELGPGIGEDTDVMYLGSWDDAHGYWVATRWIGLSGRASRVVDDWRLDVIFDLPLFGLQSRPPPYRYEKQDPLTRASFFLVGVHGDPELGSLDDWQLVRIGADLWMSGRHSLVPEGLGVGVEARFMRVVDPEPAFGLQLAFRVSYLWGW